MGERRGREDWSKGKLLSAYKVQGKNLKRPERKGKENTPKEM